jgi:hypothetical protein
MSCEDTEAKKPALSINMRNRAGIIVCTRRGSRIDAYGENLDEIRERKELSASQRVKLISCGRFSSLFSVR